MQSTLLPALRLGKARLYYMDVTPPEYGAPYIIAYVVDPGRDEPLLVFDTGPARAAEEFSEALKLLGDRKVVVYLTHIHLDHGGGVGRLASILGEQLLRVHAHPRAVRHLVDPSRLWEASRNALGEVALHYRRPDPLPESLALATYDGETHRYGGLEVRVLHTPGHASHHQSLLLRWPGGSLLFPGDSAGMVHPSVDAVAPTTPPPFRFSLYVESLRRQIRLRPGAVAYTHTGLAEAEALERHMRQVEAWKRFFEEKASRGELGSASTESLLRELEERDAETAAFAATARLISPLLYRAILLSVEGFRQYFLSYHA